jgi:hypothetical protein
MFNLAVEHEIKIRKDENGQWWLIADNSNAASAIEELLEDIKSRIRKGKKRV